MDRHHDEEQNHETGYLTYLLIWLGLLAFTGITVTIAGLDLGRWVILTSLTIASIKGWLVLSVFMHLKFEDRIFRIFALVAITTLAIFILLTFADYAFM